MRISSSRCRQTLALVVKMASSIRSRSPGRFSKSQSELQSVRKFIGRLNKHIPATPCRRRFVRHQERAAQKDFGFAICCRYERFLSFNPYLQPGPMSDLRIVSFLPAPTEMVFTLGLRDHLVVVSHECDFPAAARPKPIGVRPALSLGHIR